MFSNVFSDGNYCNFLWNFTVLKCPTEYSGFSVSRVNILSINFEIRGCSIPSANVWTHMDLMVVSAAYLMPFVVSGPHLINQLIDQCCVNYYLCILCEILEIRLNMCLWYYRWGKWPNMVDFFSVVIFYLHPIQAKGYCCSLGCLFMSILPLLPLCIPQYVIDPVHIWYIYWPQ